jgi:Cof subfamily protein (haloacid dehalogenase superfamily)
MVRSEFLGSSCNHTIARRTVPAKSGRRTFVVAAISPDELNGLKGAAVPRLCCVDMDGTILNSRNRIHPRNVEAVMRLLTTTDVGFFPATGKSRTGALKAMGKLGEYLQQDCAGGVPGVFLQGLCVYGPDGAICYERTLPEDLARSVVSLAKELGTTLIAYGVDGNTILCEQEDKETAKLAEHSEPNPEPVGSWSSVIGRESIYKFIFMAPEERILAIRPRIEEELGAVAAITRATPGMIEVLPFGASKGHGVSKLLQALNVRPEQVLAVGDGENDVEMLRLCGISVVMANGVPSAVSAAKYRTASNDEGGVADAIERFVFQAITPSVRFSGGSTAA